MAEPRQGASVDDPSGSGSPLGEGPGRGTSETAGPAPLTLRLLSEAWRRFGQTPQGRRLLARAGIMRIGRSWARRAVVERVRDLPDDVTVLIGVRNRTDPRIVNALRSLREQVYPWGRTSVLVVDYGSDPTQGDRLSRICARFGAEYLRVQGVSVWSRGRCLNLGLRRVGTKYVMTSDADLILSPHYLADAVATLRGDPLSVVCSAMLDLPEESAEATERAGREGEALDIQAWRPRCLPRLGVDLHPSAAVTLAAFYYVIRGYDEFYEGWGREDDDVLSRFMALGLRPTAIPERSFYLHQWHPKFEGLPAEARARVVDRNDAYYFRSLTILRNEDGWGRLTVARR